MSELIVSKKLYFLVFGALLVLTVTTVWVATVDLGPLNVVVALVIAMSKAVLVALIFMHVRYSGRMIVLTLVSGLLWLVILIGLTLTDYLSRDWIAGPQGF